jgi:hypothetical protein
LRPPFTLLVTASMLGLPSHKAFILFAYTAAAIPEFKSESRQQSLSQPLTLGLLIHAESALCTVAQDFTQVSSGELAAPGRRDASSKALNSGRGENQSKPIAPSQGMTQVRQLSPSPAPRCHTTCGERNLGPAAEDLARGRQSRQRLRLPSGHPAALPTQKPREPSQARCN